MNKEHSKFKSQREELMLQKKKDLTKLKKAYKVQI